MPILPAPLTNTTASSITRLSSSSSGQSVNSFAAPPTQVNNLGFGIGRGIRKGVMWVRRWWEPTKQEKKEMAHRKLVARIKHKQQQRQKDSVEIVMPKTKPEETKSMVRQFADWVSSWWRGAEQQRRGLIDTCQDKLAINTYEGDNLSSPSSVALKGGTSNRFITVWSSNRIIYARICASDSTGTCEEEFELASELIGDQSPAVKVGALLNGDFVAAWRVAGEGIHVREQPNSFFITGDLSDPTLAVLTNGDYVVAARGDTDGNIYVHHAGRLMPDFRIEANAASNPWVVASLNAGYALAWCDADGNIHVYHYDNSDAITRNYQITPNTTGGFSIATFSNGSDVLIWPTSTNEGVRIQRYDSSGNFSKEYFLSDNLFDPVIAAFADDSYVIVGYQRNDAASVIVKGRHYNSADQLLGTFEFNVNADIAILPPDAQPKPLITELVNGDFVVSLLDNPDGDLQENVVAKIFKSLPVLNPDMVVDADQAILVTYETFGIQEMGDSAGKFVEIEECLNGQFEFVSNPGVAINEILLGNLDPESDAPIQFVATGLVAPSFKASMSDGCYKSEPVSAIVDFNKAPRLEHNSFNVTQGESGKLTKEMLSATDPDGEENALGFTLSKLEHMKFFNATGVPVTQIEQYAVANTTYLHDGSRESGKFEVSVGDARVATAPVPAQVNFTRLPLVIEGSSAGEVIVGESYEYSFTVAGGSSDEIEAIAKGLNGDTLPSWLSLQRKGSGSVAEFVLKGVPNASDVTNDLAVEIKAWSNRDDAVVIKEFNLVVSANPGADHAGGESTSKGNTLTITEVVVGGLAVGFVVGAAAGVLGGCVGGRFQRRRGDSQFWSSSSGREEPNSLTPLTVIRGTSSGADSGNLTTDDMGVDSTAALV